MGKRQIFGGESGFAHGVGIGADAQFGREAQTEEDGTAASRSDQTAHEFERGGVAVGENLADSRIEAAVASVKDDCDSGFFEFRQRFEILRSKGDDAGDAHSAEVSDDLMKLFRFSCGSKVKHESVRLERLLNLLKEFCIEETCETRKDGSDDIGAFSPQHLTGEIRLIARFRREFADRFTHGRRNPFGAFQRQGDGRLRNVQCSGYFFLGHDKSFAYTYILYTITANLSTPGKKFFLKIRADCRRRRG